MGGGKFMNPKVKLQKEKEKKRKEKTECGRSLEDSWTDKSCALSHACPSALSKSL